VYDEAIYWRRLPLFVYFRQKILNGLRKQRLRRADHLIFETDVMMARAQSAGLVRQGVSVIPPTPTAFLTASALHSGLPIRILFLCGADYHKNLPRLLDVLPKISEADLPVIFMVSLSREDFRGACRKESFPSELVDRYFEFIGSVPPDRIQQYYDRCTFVGNISDLESFSNNYMEAWLVGRPILASDRDFSRAICGDSAVYVEPHDPDQFFEVLKQIACGDLNIDFMVQAGAYRLSLLPTMEQRVRAIANVVFTGGL
jgi:glycosyltransferase involved in cell wall biosynthesis